MRKIKVLAFVVLCLLCSNAFAAYPECDLSCEKNKYKDMYVPKNIYITVPNVPRDSMGVEYIANPICGLRDTSDLKVTKIEVKNEYYWESAEEVGEDEWLPNYDHYHVLIRTARITYEIKCGSGLRYQGIDYLLNDGLRKVNQNGISTTDDDVKDLLDSQHDWKQHPLEALQPDGTLLTEEMTKFGYPVKKFDYAKKQEILKRWENQPVSFPPFRPTGTPSIMPVPVLLIHGLNDTYKVWGVNPVGKKCGASIDADFQNGKVADFGYNSGSLPDILSRSQNLYTNDRDTVIDGKVYNINNNGIYFYQAPCEKVNGVWQEVAPMWKEDANLSQSYYLYAKKLVAVLDSFYRDENLKPYWKTCKDCKIDLVAHSQGGLVIREMLRALREKGINPSLENPANHIRKIVTVDTPHFGSMTAAQNPATVERYFPGLATILRDLDSDETHKLVGLDIGKFYEMAEVGAAEGIEAGYNYGSDLCSKMNLGDNKQSCDATLGMIGNGLGAIVGGITGAFTDVDVEITGKYLGPYYIKTTIDYPFWQDDDVSRDTIYTEGVLDYINETRKNGKHLDGDSDFIQNFLKNGTANAFPYLPDGSKPLLLPMYSDNNSAILEDFLEDLQEGSNKICEQKAVNIWNGSASGKSAQMDGCFNVGKLLDNYVYNSQGYSLNGKPYINDNLWSVLKSFQDDWLAKSDVVVEGTSQRFERGELNHDNPIFEGRFQKPRNYVLLKALAPHVPVAHGAKSLTQSVKPINSVIRIGAAGAPEQGYDLLCALYDNACGKYIEDMGMGAVFYLDEDNFPLWQQTFKAATKGASVSEYKARSVTLSGNFEVAPIFISKGTQGVAAELGNNQKIMATYTPNIGSVVKWIGADGVEYTETVVDKSIATQPSMSRSGNSITVTFINYFGKEYYKTYNFAGIATQTKVYVLAEQGSEMLSVMAGKATASNPETQKPPPPPPGHRLAPTTLAILHREARGEHEANTSRPRILVYNTTDTIQEFSKIAYYFTADTARKPNVVVDYPQVPVKLEHLGGDQWRFVLDVGNQKLASQALYPSKDGWQIRVHYNDWYEYSHINDWSANYNFGMIDVNRKIVIYDKNGKIIWGKEPTIIEEEKEEEEITAPQATITWKDDSPWETNALKPRITVTNTGDVALADYHAELYFRVPQGKTFAIPAPDDWYTPESTPSVKNVGGTVWKLDLHFDKHILYPADSVSEGNIGLHLTDWSSFDKTVCGVILKDSDGNILHGTEPSVAECESYNNNLLLPIYSSTFKQIHQMSFKKEAEINNVARDLNTNNKTVFNSADRNTISFTVAERTGMAEVSILNAKGATVWHRSFSNLPVGSNSISWNGANLPAGSYNMMLKTGNGIWAKRFGLR